MSIPSSPSGGSARLHRAWKDAWFSFRARVWTELGVPGWCWLSRALQMYEQEEPDVLRALRVEIGDLSWWAAWRAWNEQYEQALPSLDALRGARPSFSRPLPSELPSPPDEPEGLWARADALWHSGDRLLALGGGTIRTVLARGRATRTVRGE